MIEESVFMPRWKAKIKSLVGSNYSLSQHLFGYPNKACCQQHIEVENGNLWCQTFMKYTWEWDINSSRLNLRGDVPNLRFVMKISIIYLGVITLQCIVIFVSSPLNGLCLPSTVSARTAKILRSFGALSVNVLYNLASLVIVFGW